MAIFFNSIKAEIFSEKNIKNLNSYSKETLTEILKQWQGTIDHISGLIDKELETIGRYNKELAQVIAVTELVKSILESKGE